MIEWVENKSGFALTASKYHFYAYKQIWTYNNVAFCALGPRFFKQNGLYFLQIDSANPDKLTWRLAVVPGGVLAGMTWQATPAASVPGSHSVVLASVWQSQMFLVVAVSSVLQWTLPYIWLRVGMTWLISSLQ